MMLDWLPDGPTPMPAIVDDPAGLLYFPPVARA
jgi:hypothetical protein